MNYKRVYNNLINSRIGKVPLGYAEHHHIHPRSLGGANTPSNIVVLTAREHFIAHLLLSKVYPRRSIAWIKMQKALMRMFSKSAKQERVSPSRWYSYSCRRATKAASINQSGSGNSQYNKVWVYHEQLQESRSIKKSLLHQYIQKGWSLGRIVDWNAHNLRKNEKVHKSLSKKNDRTKKVELYTEYYKLYNLYGWDNFLKITGYTKSKPNLVAQFKRYVENFVPQNGKKRGTTGLSE